MTHREHGVLQAGGRPGEHGGVVVAVVEVDEGRLLGGGVGVL